MNTRCLLSFIAVRFTFVSLGILSLSCKAQTNIDLTNLFSSTNQFDLHHLIVDRHALYPQSELLLPTQALVERAPIRFQPALHEWQYQDDLASIEYVAFRHFDTTRFTEATYEPELKIGYSQPLNGFVNTLFNVSVASIKPCANSFVNNALSVLGRNQFSNRSTFLSVSVHSKF